jgi:hypothetical protein
MFLKVLKHSIELGLVVGILYVAYLTFTPTATAIGNAAAQSDEANGKHRFYHRPYLSTFVFGRGGGSGVIRPSRLK